MTEKINTQDANEILKLFIQTLNDAYLINENESNEIVKKEIKKFLKSIEKNVTKFFHDNIDRRKDLREKKLIEDMINLYKMQNKVKGSAFI
jgi:hypothetical protein